jgi:two-component system response regulator AlgR
MSAPLRLLIVDDEPLALERLQVLVARSAGAEVVGSASTGLAALELAERLAPDGCLLDIGIPQMDGIEIARRLAGLPSPPKVVFITAFDRFAVMAFDIDAVDYIVKPVAPDRLERALTRMRQHSAPPGKPAPRPHLSEFWASDKQGLIRVAAQDIDRITAERDYMRLHAGKRSWLVNDSWRASNGNWIPTCSSGCIAGRSSAGSSSRGCATTAAAGSRRWRMGASRRSGRLYAEHARQLAGRARAHG